MFPPASRPHPPFGYLEKNLPFGRGIFRKKSRSLFLFFGLILLSGCGGAARTQPPPAAKLRTESDLAHLTLSKRACVSLGIEVAPVRSRQVEAFLSRTGWIMPRPGNEITLTAPAAGFVDMGRQQSSFPVPTQDVPADVELLTLRPVLTPLEQIQLASLKRTADSDLAKARSSLKVASSEYQRIQKLHGQGLRGQQDLDQAHKSLIHAQEDVQAAEDKLKLFQTPALALRTPGPGKVATVHVSPGQYVQAGAPLVTIYNLNPLWVRVPVPEAELPTIRHKEKVQVALVNPAGNDSGPAGPARGKRLFKARPVGVVPQIDTASHTADLLYEVEMDEGKPLPAKDQPFKPIVAKDLMVTVWLPQGRPGTRETLVPDAAVVFDSFGGTWVYVERTPAEAKEHHFERRRVELGQVVDGLIIVRPPLPDDTRVVTRGAGVLFSREFHHAPDQPADHDEDD